MAGAAIPQVFYQQWFWFLIVLGLAVLLRFVKSSGRYPPPFPRTGAVLSKHQKGIVRAVDLFIVVSVVLFGGFLLSFLVGDVVAALSAPQPIRAMELQSAWSGGLVGMIFWSGLAVPLIGLLSPFYSDLTKRKRFFLFFLCLLPAAFTALALVAVSADIRWPMVQLGAIACLPGWIVNGPPILVGQHVVDFVRGVLSKLHLVSRDSSS
jgi:hypothetical protein